MEESLFKRGKALEDVFFSEKDRQLLEQLRRENTDRKNRDALSTASGISDVAILDALVECNVTAAAMSGVSLIPLIAVAWADGVMDIAERTAILDAAHSSGIEEGSAGYQLLCNWLAEKPPAALMEGWKGYVASLKSTMDKAAFSHLQATVMDRTKQIASAAGGILGFGKTSASESRMIAELEQAFS